MASAAQPTPSDTDLGGIPLARGDIDPGLMAQQAHSLALKLGGATKTGGGQPRGPKTPRTQGQKTHKPPKGKGKASALPQLPTPVAAPPDPVSPPPGAEIATTSEIGDIESIATALSDTVADLTSDLVAASKRIDTLEESNKALQVALTRTNREVASLAAQLQGLGLQKTTLPGPQPPAKVLEAPMTRDTRTVNVTDAPRATASQAGQIPNTTIGEWGVEDDIE